MIIKKLPVAGKSAATPKALFNLSMLLFYNILVISITRIMTTTIIPIARNIMIPPLAISMAVSPFNKVSQRPFIESIPLKHADQTTPGTLNLAR